MERKVEPTRARQGRRGTPVLIILVMALILLAVGWWFVEIYGQAIEPDDPVGGAPIEQPAEVSPATPAEEPAPTQTPQ